MTLANWTVTKSYAGTGVAIEGNRLRIDNYGVTAETVQVVTLVPSSEFSPGHIQGRIRTKMEVTEHVLDSNYEGCYGIICMMDVADVTTFPTGNCYVFGFAVVGAAPYWRLTKYVTGISINGSPDHVGTGDTTLTPALNTDYALEVTWAYDALIGGTNLVCKVGLAENNFGDLVTVYDYTDSSSPHLTTVGEGLFWADLKKFLGGDLKRVYYNDTSIVPLDGTPIL